MGSAYHQRVAWQRSTNVHSSYIIHALKPSQVKGQPEIKYRLA